MEEAMRKIFNDFSIKKSNFLKYIFIEFNVPGFLD